MSLQHKELVAVFDQMTLYADEQIMRQLFTKEELRKIEIEIRKQRSKQTRRETNKFYQKVVQNIGKQILKKCRDDENALEVV